MMSDQIPAEVIEAAAWALIDNDTDVVDRGVSEEHYRDRLADVQRVAPVIAAWARKRALEEVVAMLSGPFSGSEGLDSYTLAWAIGSLEMALAAETEGDES